MQQVQQHRRLAADSRSRVWWSSTYHAYWCGLLAAGIWGSTYAVTTELLPVDRPLLASMLRALPAGILLLLWQRELPSGHWWWRLAVLGIFNIGCFFYGLFVAAYHLPGGIAALVMSCQPVLVMMLVVIFFAERFSFRLLLAAVMASTGITLLVSAQQGVLSTTGLIAGFGAAMSMAIGIVLSKKWPKPADLSLAAFTGWQLVAGGLVLLPLTLWQEGWPTTVSTQNVIGYLYLCLMGAVLAYLLWFRALQQLPAVTVSFLAFASPLSAVVMGYFCLAQTLTWLQFCGALAIFAAILFATKNSVATANANT